MFRGRYSHTIDPKGRLSIPAKFRQVLADRSVDALVLTEGDRCIWAYPLDEWERLERDVQQRQGLSPAMRTLLRKTIASAKDCVVDGVGRTLIPPELRKYARLDKDVMIVGMLGRFEIWNNERWGEHYSEMLGHLDDQALGDFGL